jgi:hypothetical protein
MQRQHEEALSEHQVRNPNAENGSRQLGGDVARNLSPPQAGEASATDTAGLKWAPEIGPGVRIKRKEHGHCRDRVG